MRQGATHSDDLDLGSVAVDGLLCSGVILKVAFKSSVNTVGNVHGLSSV
jgi:hypothetical protein